MSPASSTTSLISLPDLLVPTYKQMLTHLLRWLDKAVQHFEKEEEKESNNVPVPVDDGDDGDDTDNRKDCHFLLSGRLISDMFPLTTQVRFICFQAQEGVYRVLLQKKEIPQDLLDMVEEARTTLAQDGTTPGTIDDAKECIMETLEFLNNTLTLNNETTTSTTDYEVETSDKVGSGGGDVDHDNGAVKTRTDDDTVITLELPGGIIFDMTPVQYVRDWAIPQFYFHLVVAYSILRKAGVPLGKADYVPHMFQYLRKNPTTTTTTTTTTSTTSTTNPC